MTVNFWRFFFLSKELYFHEKYKKQRIFWQRIFGRRNFGWRVLDHFTERSTENFWPKGHLTETQFDRTPFDRMPFDRKFIRPNRRSIERRAVWPKVHFTERSRFQDMVIWPQLLSTKNVIWPKKNAHKVVWPKIHLTESSFDRKLFLKMITWPKGHLTESSFDRKLFSKNVHLTECFYYLENCRFRKIVIWLTVNIPLE
jgi:hypothetical protein